MYKFISYENTAFMKFYITGRNIFIKVIKEHKSERKMEKRKEDNIYRVLYNALSVFNKLVHKAFISAIK